jgi:hypothetical protein
MRIATDVEEAGNHVHRLIPQEVAAFLRRHGFGRVRWRRTLMYYQHEPSAWFRWFEGAASFTLFRIGFWALNLLVGHWGNKLALGATRRAAANGAARA